MLNSKLPHGASQIDGWSPVSFFKCSKCRIQSGCQNSHLTDTKHKESWLEMRKKSKSCLYTCKKEPFPAGSGWANSAHIQFKQKETEITVLHYSDCESPINHTVHSAIRKLDFFRVDAVWTLQLPPWVRDSWRAEGLLLAEVNVLFYVSLGCDWWV